MTTAGERIVMIFASWRMPRWLTPLALISYIGLLHWTYTSFVAPRFGYLNMGYRSPDWWGYALLAAGVVGLGLLHPHRIGKPSDAVAWLHFLMATAPTALIAQMTPFLPRGLAFRFGVAVEACWLGVLLLLRWGSRWRADLPAPLARVRNSVSARLWLAGMLTISLAAGAISLLLPGVGHRFVSFANVSETRLQYREALAAVPAVIPYVLLGAVCVTNPALIAYGWIRQNWWLIGVGIGGQLLNYSVTGSKTTAVSLIVASGLVFLLGRVDVVSGTAFLVTLVGAMLTALAAFLVTGVTAPAFYFTTRTMVVPGNVAAAHVAYFSKVDPLYWSQAFMSRFVHYPYSESPSYIIGYFLSGRHDTNANVNLFGDGYESARYAGIALECLVLVGVLLLLDRVSSHAARRLVLPTVLVPAYLLTNVNVFTALLTSGFALSILVLFFAPLRTSTTIRTTAPSEKTFTTTDVGDRNVESRGMAGRRRLVRRRL